MEHYCLFLTVQLKPLPLLLTFFPFVFISGLAASQGDVSPGCSLSLCVHEQPHISASLSNVTSKYCTIQ